jgi:hypothetical protein
MSIQNRGKVEGFKSLQNHLYFDNMDFMESWKEKVKVKDAEREIRYAEHKAKANAQKYEILEALKSYGIDKKSILTNCYAYEFDGKFKVKEANGDYIEAYNNLHVNFVNQDMRLCGDMHRPLLNEEEKKCIRNACDILRSSDYSEMEKDKFQKEFNYRSFVLKGPTSQTIRGILEIAEMPLDLVNILQDKEDYEIDNLRFMGKTKIGSSPFGDVYRLDDGTVRIN